MHAKSLVQDIDQKWRRTTLFLLCGVGLLATAQHLLGDFLYLWILGVDLVW